MRVLYDPEVLVAVSVVDRNRRHGRDHELLHEADLDHFPEDREHRVPDHRQDPDREHLRAEVGVGAEVEAGVEADRGQNPDHVREVEVDQLDQGK